MQKNLNIAGKKHVKFCIKKKVNPKTTLDQILICAQIKYDLKLVKAGRFLKNIKDGRTIKPLKYEKDIHYVVRANFSTFKDYLNKYSKLKINSSSDVYKSIRDMYAKKIKLYPDKIDKALSETLLTPQAVAQLQINIK